MYRQHLACGSILPRWPTALSHQQLRRAGTGVAVDFGLDQAAPDRNSILSTTVLSWVNGMDWVDIGCAIPPPAVPTRLAGTATGSGLFGRPPAAARREAQRQWQDARQRRSEHLRRFRETLAVELRALGVDDAAVERSALPHVLPSIVSVTAGKGGKEVPPATSPRSGQSLRSTTSTTSNKWGPDGHGSTGGHGFVSEAWHAPRCAWSPGGVAQASSAAAASPTAHPDVEAVCAVLRYASLEDGEEHCDLPHTSPCNASSKSHATTSGSITDLSQRFILTTVGAQLKHALGGLGDGRIGGGAREGPLAASSGSAPLASIQETTDRITLFVLPKRVITVHLHDPPVVSRLRREWDGWYRHYGPQHLVNALVKGCAVSFLRVAQAEGVLLDRLENRMFSTATRQFNPWLRLLYAVNRRSSIRCRVLSTLPVTHRSLMASVEVESDSLHTQDVQQAIARARLASADVRDATQGLISLHFQRASAELEGLMRVLTVFSAVFIPLELLNAIFGMNFSDLPWITEDDGALKVVALMVGTSWVTLVVFRARRIV